LEIKIVTKTPKETAPKTPATGNHYIRYETPVHLFPPGDRSKAATRKFAHEL
jgi:hypothetical protein